MQQDLLPYDRFLFFKEQLGLSKEELGTLAPYRGTFVSRKEEFASYFYNFFYKITRTRMVLQHEQDRGNLKRIWTNWFASLFTTEWDEAFFSELWRSGIRHVEVNLDQQFLSLGYCIVRQFCHQIINSEIPLTSRGSVSLTIGKMVDLCLLVETSAYMAHTSHCDREVMKGVSHQLRNPITVIGGNAKRLQKKVPVDSDIYRSCENIIVESKRLERLVIDIGAYIEVFQHESKYVIVSLEELINSALGRLSAARRIEAEIVIELDKAYPDIQGDPTELESMLYYLLENSLEAVSAEKPYIKITSRVKSFASNFIDLEIFNTGLSPKPEDIGLLFSPFSSSKPAGTGFGLPIAQLAARKNLARLELIPVHGEGTRCIVSLPLPG